MRQLNTAARHMSLPKPTVADSRLMALTHGIGHAVAQTIFMYFRYVGTLPSVGCNCWIALPQLHS